MTSGHCQWNEAGDMKEAVRALVMASGACACGFTDCEPVSDGADDIYRQWIASGRNAGMDYAGRYADVRRDPALLLPGASTIICTAFSYRQSNRHPLFADYALGQDYHDVLRRRLSAVADEISRCWGGETRVCVDTAPLRERYMAARAGIGIIGDNGLLIVDRAGIGSKVLLAEILWTQPLPPDPSRLGERCQSCGACARACPGGALDACGGVDARQCRSYLTIEHRGPLPEDLTLPGRIYGCDICQDVCPYNAETEAEAATIDEFKPSGALMRMRTAEAFATMTPEEFRDIFRHSAVRRVKYEGLRRNASKK